MDDYFEDLLKEMRQTFAMMRAVELSQCAMCDTYAYPNHVCLTQKVLV